MKEKSRIPFYNKKLRLYAKDLRNHSTLSEIVLWTEVLKARRLRGYQFLRQRPIGGYIVDFLCKELKLVIELDGSTHFEKGRMDKIRQKNLESLGFHVLRFEDIDVIGDCDKVRNKLVTWIENYEDKHPEVLTFKNRGKRKY